MKQTIEKLQPFCEQHLSSENFEKWEDIKNELNHTAPELLKNMVPNYMRLDKGMIDVLDDMLTYAVNNADNDRWSVEDLTVFSQWENKVSKFNGDNK